nr:hypothetical protein BaRGS_014590 [Batillaria attramentaria]
MADKSEMIRELKERVAQLEPLEDEPDFFTSEETIIRYLKSRDWKLEEAERMLMDTVEYRRRTRPLRLDCSFCHSRPGFHSMRQVGHDEAGRPVMFANFAQASTHRNSAEDAVCHVTYLIENAKRSMALGISTWVFVMDCTGMTLSSCNPKLAYAVSNVLSNHYPEHLGTVICLNHSPVFHGVWKAIKQFVPPQTAAKVKLVRSKAKIAEVFSKHFSPELAAWLKEEIALNKQKPLPKEQLEFWNAPSTGSGKAHDPRGCPTYVSEYLEPFKRECGKQRNCDGHAEGDVTSGEFRYLPHPNVADCLRGHVVRAVALTPEEKREREHAQEVVEAKSRDGGGEVEDGEVGTEGAIGGNGCDLDIPSDLQIPPTARPLTAPS